MRGAAIISVAKARYRRWRDQSKSRRSLAHCLDLMDADRLPHVEQECRRWMDRTDVETSGAFARLLLRVLRATGRHHEERQLLDRLVDAHPDDHDLRISSIQCSLALGDFERARSEAETTNAAGEKLSGLIREIRRRDTPAIMLCALPKSGSTYTRSALAAGLGKPELNDMGGAFPKGLLVQEQMLRLAAARPVWQNHVAPNEYNTVELNHHVDRVIVALRDPRQALLSLAHFLPPTIVNLDPAFAKHWNIPDRFLTDPLSNRIEWLIANYFQWQIDWIRSWRDAVTRNDFRPRILFVHHENLSSDPTAFFNQILDFYGIDRDLFSPPEKPVPGHMNFRKGEVSEWREEFSAAQIERCNTMIPAEFAEEYGWAMP